MADKRLIYRGEIFSGVQISPVCYVPDYFQMELDLESDVFYELRRDNGISPIKINQSSSKDLKEIEPFFENNRKSFYFLFHENWNLIGSILHIRNYIQSLSVAKEFQRQEYGEALVKYCSNKILDKGYASVELNILPGNIKAEKLYKKLCFVEL